MPPDAGFSSAMGTFVTLRQAGHKGNRHAKMCSAAAQDRESRRRRKTASQTLGCCGMRRHAVAPEAAIAWRIRRRDWLADPVAATKIEHRSPCLRKLAANSGRQNWQIFRQLQSVGSVRLWHAPGCGGSERNPGRLGCQAWAMACPRMWGFGEGRTTGTPGPDVGGLGSGEPRPHRRLPRPQAPSASPDRELRQVPWLAQPGADLHFQPPLEQPDPVADHRQFLGDRARRCRDPFGRPG